jgi:hypothetical protein
MEALGPLAILAIVVFLIVLTIAWIMLPFARIGTSPILRQILEELRKANDVRELRRGAAPLSKVT